VSGVELSRAWVDAMRENTKRFHLKAKFHNPLLLPTNLIFHQKIMKTRKLDIIEVGSGKMERKKLLHGKEMAQIK
jgi:hypothetical protein